MLRTNRHSYVVAISFTSKVLSAEQLTDLLRVRPSYAWSKGKHLSVCVEAGAGSLVYYRNEHDHRHDGS